jgi:predicted ATP-binding protein involved in virulence
MYLKKLNIRNFRCFANYEIEFAPRVTVLFGKNGSGKTTLIHALHKALSFMMHSEKIKEKDPKTKKWKVVGEQSLRGGNPYVGVEGFSKTGEAHYDGVKRADYAIEIKAEANLDNRTPIEWAMNVFYIDNRLRTSEYKNAFNQLYDWHKKTGERPLLAYYSDGYPHYSNIAKSKKENSKEAFLVKSFDESFGYTDWNTEMGCTNTWLSRLETKIRTIENSKRRISITENEVIHKVALEEMVAAEKEVNYIVGVLKRFSKDDEYCRIENIEISPYDAYLHILDKNAKDRSFRKLPAGYRRMYYIVLDLAYRSFFLTSGERTDIEGIVIIDEIDLHLHPELEKVVLKRFMDTFPNLQFIVSTHSPLVLTGLETEGKPNRILQMNAETNAPKPILWPDVYGLDYNTGLEDIMGVESKDNGLDYMVSLCAYMRKREKIAQADNIKQRILSTYSKNEEELEKMINKKITEM